MDVRRLATIAAAGAFAIGLSGCSIIATPPVADPVHSSNSPASAHPVEMEAHPLPAVLAAPKVQGTVVGTFGGANVGGSFDARHDGLTVALTCQGAGSVTVTIVGNSTYSMPCVADQPTPYENRDYTAHGVGQVQVTTAGSVVWALTIARLPLAGAPTV